MKIYIVLICALFLSCNQNIVHEEVVVSDDIIIRKIDFIAYYNEKDKIGIEHFFAIQTDKILADSIMIDSVDKFILSNVLDTIDLNNYDYFSLQFVKESDEIKRIKTDDNGIYNINIYSTTKTIFLNYDWSDGVFYSKVINGKLYFDNFDTIPNLTRD
jgi:hypothetical protein